MSTFEITAEIRVGTGKGVARKLRAAGRLPAVLYGGGREASSLILDPSILDRLSRMPLGLNTPMEMTVDGLAGRRQVMVRDIQRHPVSRKVLHLDLLEIDPQKPVVVSVRVVPVGRSVGEQLGGRINLMRRTIQVRCMVDDIPEKIDLDVTALNIGHKVFVDELALPDGVTAVFEQRFPVLAISAKGRADAVLDEEEEDEGAEDEAGAEDTAPATPAE